MKHGLVNPELIDQAKEFRAQQNTILKSIEDHQSANQSYMEEGIRILELACRAAELLAKQPAEEKRRLLNCVLKGASWQHGNLKADFRQPFDMLAKTALSNSASDSKENPIEASTGEKEIWLPGMDSNSTLEPKWAARIGGNCAAVLHIGAMDIGPNGEPSWS